MKRLYLTATVLAVIVFSPGALAQQQINNDGANANELQPQSQGIQNNAGSERYKSDDITNDVGNSDVLKNAQVGQLNVVGAPAGTTTTSEPSRGIFSWLVFAAGILLVLMAPALLYVRDVKRKGGFANEAVNPAAGFPTDTALEEDVLDDLNEAKSEIKQEIKQDKKAKSKKKAKKAPHSKPKRGKKKKK